MNRSDDFGTLLRPMHTMVSSRTVADREARTNLLLAGVSTVVFLAAGEVGLRSLGLPRGGLGQGALGGRSIAQHLGGSLHAWQVEDPDLLWKLRPWQRATELGNRGPWTVTTDARGMRSTTPGDAGGGPRILCLGDSVTMGFGVDDADAYPAVLADLLRSSPAYRGAEVVNAGVLGYTSEQGRVLVRRLVPEIAPDVVIVGYGINDNWPTVYPDRTLIGDVTLVRRTQRLLARSRIYATLRQQIVAEKIRRGAEAQEIGPRVAPERYRENLEAIVRTVRDSGAKPILFAPTSKFAEHQASKSVELHASMNVYRGVMAGVAASEGVPYLDHPVLSGRSVESARHFMDWCHPDAEGLCILATELAGIVRTLTPPGA